MGQQKKVEFLLGSVWHQPFELASLFVYQTRLLRIYFRKTEHFLVACCSTIKFGCPFLLLFCSSKVVLTRFEEPFVFFSNQLGICGLRVQRQLHMEVSQLHYNSRLYTKMVPGFIRVTSHENALLHSARTTRCTQGHQTSLSFSLRGVARETSPRVGISHPSLVPRPEKRAWYTLSAHAPKCTENPGTSYISVKQSVNHST